MRRLTYGLLLALLATPLSAQTVTQDSVRAKVAADSIIRISTSARVDRLAAELKLIVNRLVAALRPALPPPPPPAPVPPPASVPGSPGTPAFAVVTGSTTSTVSAAWAAARGAIEYVWSAGRNSGPDWPNQAGGTTLTGATLLNVPNGLVLWFCVRAQNTAGPSAASACNSFTVPGAVPPPAPVPPPPPAPPPAPAPPPPPPPVGPGNPVPSGTIYVDTRAGGANNIQAVTTLAAATAAWGVGTPSPYLSANIGFTTNVDGVGTHAFSASLGGWGGVPRDGGSQLQWYLPTGPKPKALYIQWKHRMGRTATGGGIGAVGFFDITNQNDPGGNAGRKYLLMLRDVADGGSGGRVDHVWAGPSPVSVHTEGWYGLNPYPGNLGLNRCAFNPEAHINETIVFTHYLQTESAPGASDGAVRVWYNGVLCAEHTGVPSGHLGIHRFQFPATFRSPIADQTEYFWDIVVWRL